MTPKAPSQTGSLATPLLRIGIRISNLLPKRAGKMSCHHDRAAARHDEITQQGSRRPQVNSTAHRDRLQTNLTETKINNSTILDAKKKVISCSFPIYFWGHHLEAYLPNRLFFFLLVMFQREKHHTNSEQGGIGTASGLCRLSMSYKAIDLEDTHIFLLSAAIDRYFSNSPTPKKKYLHYHSACQSILELLRHVTLELKQRVYSWFVLFPC